MVAVAPGEIDGSLDEVRSLRAEAAAEVRRHQHVVGAEVVDRSTYRVRAGRSRFRR